MKWFALVISILILSGCSTYKYFSEYRPPDPAFCYGRVCYDGYVTEGYYHNFHAHTLRDFGCYPRPLPPLQRIPYRIRSYIETGQGYHNGQDVMREGRWSVFPKWKEN